MEKRTSAFARILAALALAGAVVVVIVVISGSLGDSDSSSKSQHGDNHHAKKHRTKAAVYVVETGDTLTSIAHQTGVPVAEILKLNPAIDPQILIAGEKLNLR